MPNSIYIPTGAGIGTGTGCVEPSINQPTYSDNVTMGLDEYTQIPGVELIPSEPGFRSNAEEVTDGAGAMMNRRRWKNLGSAARQKLREDWLVRFRAISDKNAQAINEAIEQGWEPGTSAFDFVPSWRLGVRWVNVSACAAIHRKIPRDLAITLKKTFAWPLTRSEGEYLGLFDGEMLDHQVRIFILLRRRLVGFYETALDSERTRYSDRNMRVSRVTHDVSAFYGEDNVRNHIDGRPCMDVPILEQPNSSVYPSFNRHARLMGHQIQFAEKAITQDSMALFGEVGVGKTFAAMAAIANLRARVFKEGATPETRPPNRYPELKTLWITSNGARQDTVDQLLFGPSIIRINGASVLSGESSTRRVQQIEASEEILKLDERHRPAKPTTTWVLNYETLIGPVFEELKKHHWDVVVLDEAHTIRNPNSSTTRAVIELGSLVRFKIILTGTPMLENEIDLWAPLFFCDNEAWEEETEEVREIGRND